MINIIRMFLNCGERNHAHDSSKRARIYDWRVK